MYMHPLHKQHVTNLEQRHIFRVLPMVQQAFQDVRAKVFRVLALLQQRVRNWPTANSQRGASQRIFLRLKQG
jgi:hypothetical protein